MDVCLNVMPLFHIHGLIAAVLGSLSAGGSIYCSPGFNALKVFAWLGDANPSWYTAVPTMHQAILSRAGRNRDIIESVPLRLIRSSSASLAPQVMQNLEDTFGTPVIESYGMTEAAHQMTSNPLPPRSRKPGSVGVAAGPDVSIMNDEGSLLSAGTVGEVVIRGINVTAGYQSNPDANAEAFTNGWFRTGDQGMMDDDGYFSLTGRLKEIINRGGEKISAEEVENLILQHAAVKNVACVPMPDERLGERMCAYVVPQAGQTLGLKDLIGFLETKEIARFKMPERLELIDDLPVSTFGKVSKKALGEWIADKIAAERG